MKSREEIEQLANDYWEGCDGCDANDKYFFIKGFVCAYIQLQEDMGDKKYTEDDVIHLMFNASHWDTFKEGEVGYDMSLSEYIQHCLQILNKQD